jgi:hypothetical protein
MEDYMVESAHEPEAEVMSAEDVWEDAQQLADVLRLNLSKAEPMVGLRIPLSVFLSALNGLSRDELVALRSHVEELLAV